MESTADAEANDRGGEVCGEVPSLVRSREWHREGVTAKSEADDLCLLSECENVYGGPQYAFSHGIL